MTKTLGAAADAATAPSVYGVLQIGEARVALALQTLREVLPCPPRFCALPAAAPGLLEAVNVRGKVVPVLDLRALLGGPAQRTDGQLVVVVRHEGAVLGLLADAVCGLTRPAPGTLDELAPGTGAALLFTASFERAEDASVVSVLDVAALMHQPGVPRMRESATAQAFSVLAAETARESLMLVRCGDIRLAADVLQVHATLPRVTLLPSSMDGRVCRGVIEHAGVRVPAVDPLALMELGRLADPGACQALLLRNERGLVALLVSQVIDIVRVAAVDLLALPPLAVRRPEFIHALLHLPGHGEHLVLASQALADQPDLQALSSLNARIQAGGGGVAGGRSPAAAGESASAGGSAGFAVITYDIGAEVATRLTQVSEVLPLPAQAARPAGGHPAVLGTFTHRGRAVTLICLASLLGARTAPDLGQGRVLLVGEGESRFGFVVPRLCHIENSLWAAAPLEGRGARGAPPHDHPLGRHAAVELGHGAQRRTLHLIDLEALAAELTRGADPAAERRTLAEQTAAA